MTTRIEFDESESCSLEDAQALIDLLSRVTALEQAGIITNVYVTDDVLEAELDAMDEAEQAALEPASA
jgi:hypothetical protein